MVDFAMILLEIQLFSGEGGNFDTHTKNALEPQMKNIGFGWEIISFYPNTLAILLTMHGVAFRESFETSCGLAPSNFQSEVEVWTHQP